MVSILERARKDMERITSDTNGFAVSIKFTSPNEDVAIVNGTHTKHHLGLDPETLQQVSSKTASIAVAEKFLIDSYYPVRDSKDEVDLENHKIEVKDSTGITKQYVVLRFFADENLGLIVIILGDFE